MTKQIANFILDTAHAPVFPAGKHMTFFRQKVIAMITKSCPSTAKCGVHKYQEILLQDSGINQTGKCPAGIESELLDWLIEWSKE